MQPDRLRRIDRIHVSSHLTLAIATAFTVFLAMADHKAVVCELSPPTFCHQLLFTKITAHKRGWCSGHPLGYLWVCARALARVCVQGVTDAVFLFPSHCHAAHVAHWVFQGLHHWFELPVVVGLANLPHFRPSLALLVGGAPHGATSYIQYNL